MTGAWHWWVRRWTAEETGTALAVFRILLGLLVFVDLWSLILGGVVDPLYMPRAEGGLAQTNHHYLVDLLGGHTPALTWQLIGSGIVLAALTVIGLGGRLTHFLLLQVVLMLQSLVQLGSYDRLTTIALFVLVLGNATATLSVDCRRKTGAWQSDQPVLVTARYLGVCQLFFVYIATGLAKLGSGWDPPYNALYQSFMNPSVMRWPEPWWLGYAYPITQVGTATAWWWEVGFCLMFAWFFAHAGWFGEQNRQRAVRYDLRIPFLGLGIITHTTLAMLLNVGTFTAVTFCYYVLVFSPDEYRRLFARLKRS